jgi:LPS-assembly protein
MWGSVRGSAGLVILVLGAAPATPQQVLADYTVVAARQERVGENHWLLSGGVEIEQRDLKVYADEMEAFTDQNRVIATGNVVMTQGKNRIAADRADFNSETRLGTFYHASGIATMQPPRQVPVPGAMAVPQLAGQQTDVYFFGDEVEKIGPKKYRIRNGGFSTCVQPTPRWDLSADTIVLNIDHYTLLRQVVLNVKGVPLLYLPFIYYPTKEEGRATGFLIPTYGSSTIRGQSLHNAFFWAINRSADLTMMHDWFSRTGQGLGGEYRYNLGGGSDGTIRTYLLDQRETTYETFGRLPGSRSYEIRGSGNQVLPGNFRARARVDYFSSIATNQTFNTDIYDASRNQRSFGGNIVGVWKTLSLNGTFDRNEWFNTTSSSGVTGNSPRIAFSRYDRPIFGNAPLYFSVAGEFAHLDRQTRSNGTVIDDRSLARFDITPQIRYPFKRWQWFTVNSTLAWRDTFYSRSLDASTGAVVDDNVNRGVATVTANASGPILTRVWNTPDNAYAERFKHSIEPFAQLQRTSSIDNFSRIVQVDGVDTIVGGTTSVVYGVNNRIYAKRRIGAISQAQEIVSVEITQSYYTNPLASRYDSRYNTGFGTAPPSNVSPISLSVRAVPTTNLNASLRIEFDSRAGEMRTLSANGTHNWTNRVQTSVGWSHKFFVRDLPGFDDPNLLDHYLNVSTNARTRDNRFGGMYAFNFDVLRSTLLQQRVSAFYNAQCCGIAMEYQQYNYAGFGTFVIPADHRFFLSFTLAGLGNFSPFNGALGGVPR